ncbi:hypothetical protein Tco_0459735 [Tanacetum coccineum]
MRKWEMSSNEVFMPLFIHEWDLEAKQFGTPDSLKGFPWLPFLAAEMVTLLLGPPAVRGASISFSVFGTMFGHKTANSYNLLISRIILVCQESLQFCPGDPIGLFYCDGLGLCIPPRQGIIGQGISLGLVFLLGLSAFAMAAAYASRAAVMKIYSEGKKAPRTTLGEVIILEMGGKTTGEAIKTWVEIASYACWAYAFHQDKASSVRVPVANVTLFSSTQLLRENTDSVRSNQRTRSTAPSVPLK